MTESKKPREPAGGVRFAAKLMQPGNKWKSILIGFAIVLAVALAFNVFA